MHFSSFKYRLTSRFTDLKCKRTEYRAL